MPRDRVQWITAACLVATLAGVRVASGNSNDVSPATNEEPQVMAIPRYDGYVGTTPPLAISFHYPAGWAQHEEAGRGEPFRQVRFMGPRNREDSYTCYFAVMGAPLTAAGGKHRSAVAFIEHYTSHLPPEAKILQSRQTVVDGMPATDLLISYVQPPWHHVGLKAIDIPITTRTVILERGSTLFQLSYSADAREYDAQAQAFEELVTTFRFQSNEPSPLPG